MSQGIRIDRNAVYHVVDAAELCEISQSSISAAIKAGELPATKRSRRTYIEGENLWRWITGRPQVTQGAGRD
jgi:hypothetical protein